jgi:signal transduction histidine kinase
MCPKPTDQELTHGVPVFLDQLTAALRFAEASEVVSHQQIAHSARLHGSDLFRTGLTIAQVVHGYGDVCQTITSLAIEQKAAISTSEFQTLNLCLDEAIAEAVTEFARLREGAVTDRGTERLGMLAHELRNLLNTATLSFESVSSGRVSPSGSTALIHRRSLTELGGLIDRALAEVRLDAGLRNSERISVAQFIEEMEIGAVLQARARGMQFSLNGGDPALFVEGDRPLLAAIIGNFLQNAFKFSRKGGSVTLRVRATPMRILLDVEDECGGLPPGKYEELFRPFEQRGADRAGVGLGLTICKRAAEANAGQIHVHDLPGKGCVFTLDLPRQPAAPALTAVQPSSES